MLGSVAWLLCLRGYLWPRVRTEARLLAALTRAFGIENLALAEDVVQETLARAFADGRRVRSLSSDR